MSGHEPQPGTLDATLTTNLLVEHTHRVNKRFPTHHAEAQVEDAFGGGWSPHDPTFANSHSISDFFRAEEAADFFDAALSWQEEQGLPPVYHETHRKRWLHSPWVCRDFVLPNYRPAPPPPPTAAARAPPAAAVEGKADTRLPLGLVADLSHFCVVAETSPSDPELCAVVEALAPYVRHVHARVGYDHGPQVGDPREPYWEEYVKGHERWWDQIWEAQALAGQEVSTMTMEFGPPNYQHTDPKTGEPLADVWEVNHWMARRLQARFANKYGVENTSSVTSLYSINP